jgi:phenylacetate-CoA ligase
MFGFLSKNVVFPTYWRSRGIDVKAKLHQSTAAQWLSKDELERKQWLDLEGLLYHAFKNVPFYRRRIEETVGHPSEIKTMADLEKLPLLEKKDIQEHFTEMTANNFLVSSLLEDSTGGSTGQNISFYEDKNELAHRYAATMRSDAWAGYTPGTRYAQIWGSALDIDKSANLKRSIDKLLLRRLFISSFKLSDQDIEKAIVSIKQFKPRILIGYPTPLYRLANYIAAKGADMGTVDAIISSAETLYDHQREAIESAFQCKIFNRYGCREFGPIASECEYHRGLHIFTDRFIVEARKLKTDGPQEYHELVITDLHKYGMPLIRYRIGDMGIPTGRMCPCGRGFPLLEKIEGRTFDMIRGINGNYVSGTFWTLLFRSVPGINVFQVVQKKKDLIEVTLELSTEIPTASLLELEKAIKDKCGFDTRVNIDIVPKILPGKSGKHRFIMSELADH